MTPPVRWRRGLLAAVLVCGIAAACGSDPAPPGGGPADGGSDAGVDGGADGGNEAGPRTHCQIINAPTSAQSILKAPVTPLRLPDGGLPPLP